MDKYPEPAEIIDRNYDPDSPLEDNFILLRLKTDFIKIPRKIFINFDYILIILSINFLCIFKHDYQNDYF
jgi:hypothetical protein